MEMLKRLIMYSRTIEVLSRYVFHNVKVLILTLGREKRVGKKDKLIE